MKMRASVKKFENSRIVPENKPGTAQVGPISKAQKWAQKDFNVSSILFYSTRVKKKLKKIRFFLKIFIEFFFEIFLVSGKSHNAEKWRAFGIF